MVIACMVPGLRAEEGGKPFAWSLVKVQVSAFSRDLGMLDAERDEYATNLANCAAYGITQSKATQAALDRGQRLFALALNLSPRNRRAIVLNFQLAKGMLPEEAKGDYSTPVIARLLLARGQILAKTESQENRLLARMFFQLAAELDPKNEDAVYASEVDRLDHGTVDWTFLTAQRTLPTPDPPKEAVHPPVVPPTGQRPTGERPTSPPRRP